jgi:amidase/aspartyl-tRNA(Asn)/glutamyl-tRNA(Gln) amidotransferase subunit A
VSRTAAELLAHDASAIADAVRDGVVSASALAHACLARIAQTEPRVNAFTAVTAQRALATAAALDARLAVGDSTARALP